MTENIKRLVQSRSAEAWRDDTMSLPSKFIGTDFLGPAKKSLIFGC